MDLNSASGKSPTHQPPVEHPQSPPPNPNPFAAALDELVGPDKARATRTRRRPPERLPASPPRRGVSSSSITQAFGVEGTVESDLATIDAILLSRNHGTARAVSIRYGCVVVSCPKADVWALRVDATQLVELWQRAGVTASSLRTTSP